MRCWNCLCIAVAAGLAPGCSSSPQTPADQLPTAETYAQGVKQDIHDLANAARGKPKVARQQGAVLTEKLEVYEKQPVGTHGPIYAELLAKTRELAERERSVDDVNRILTHMLKLANQLPGQVQRPPPDPKSSRLEPSRRKSAAPSPVS
jgi:hypothetical protein